MRRQLRCRLKGTWIGPDGTNRIVVRVSYGNKQTTGKVYSHVEAVMS